MTKKFQRKLILSFLLIFTAYTCGIVVFEHQRAKQYKKYALEEKLDAYVEAIAKYVLTKKNDYDLRNMSRWLPDNLRISIIDQNGKVRYDNAISDILENHGSRPEIIEARKNGSGSSLRNSALNSEIYLYYAKKINSEFIRVALPYDEQMKFFFKPNNDFFYFVAIVFSISFAFILYVGNYFGKIILQLRDFSQQDSETGDVAIPDFPKDEIGEIGAKIVENFRRIKKDEKRLAQEKEKLLLHLQASAEGICFFNADKTVAFYNGLFLQHFNIISHNSVNIGKDILLDECFESVISFLNNRINEDYFETHISMQGRNFLLRMNVFKDKSFEMLLVDVTANEKNKHLKQEMTGNIAHELRTPITSIRGFLEILLNNNIAKEKSHEFLQRAFAQTQVLSELVSDMSLLTKMDEKAQSLKLEMVNISQLIKSVSSDISEELKEKGIKFNSDVDESIAISGNPTLLYSIFRNLSDNVIRYAGSNVDINIKLYEIKGGKAYFIFADNGNGIEDERHLNRLFERFYRTQDGRSRNTGGSGLGLSIVKNAVHFHGGEISARNGKERGLEFLFTLSMPS